MKQSPILQTEAVSGSAWSGFAHGLIPLAILASSIAVTLLLTLTTRALTASIDFGVQQWIVAGMLVAGLLVSIVAYSVTLVRTYRQWRAKRHDRDDATAIGMLWALIVTSIMVLLPVVAAALVPQHPAP